MTRPIRFIIYKAKDGYRWHATRNGRIMAESGEAYTRRRDSFRALDSFLAFLTGARIDYEAARAAYVSSRDRRTASASRAVKSS